ncbi:hypothetical protein ZH29_002339 [Salmonella enterica subsp. enterica]|nr:hypothetical protein [Salmonella enterica subsp. enterica]MCU8645845.1 hypothetical protein [Escherichia coli]
MTIIFIVLGCLLSIAAVAIFVTAWVIGVTVAVSMFIYGYEAWSASDTCSGFCGAFPREQGFYIMCISAVALVVFMVLAIKSIKKG